MKCCSGCHKRILRAVENVLAGRAIEGEEGKTGAPEAAEDDNSQSAWPEKEEEKTPPAPTPTPAPAPPGPKVPGLEESEEEEVEEDKLKTEIKEEPKEPVPAEPCAQPSSSSETVEPAKEAAAKPTPKDRCHSSGESNATLSADEAEGAAAGTAASAPPSASSPGLVYKPKFTGSAHGATGSPGPANTASVRDLIDSTISRFGPDLSHQTPFTLHEMLGTLEECGSSGRTGGSAAGENTRS